MSVSLLSLLALLGGCGAPGRGGAERPPLAPGPGAAAELQRLLIAAQPGDIITLAAGRFEFTDGLSLDQSKVTLQGAGAEAKVLSFKGQTSAGEGLLVTGDDVVLQGFSVEDTKGDGIKSKGADRITYRDLAVVWTRGPDPKNGAYGVYPVASTGVLIERVSVTGASDAGIYVGQSRDIVVRDSRAELNVAGIEIENSSNADVHGNVVTRNAGGILVFDLPDLPVKDGRSIRVFDNQVYANDTPNFAPPGNIVANVPSGTGIMVMAASDVHVFRNQLRLNRTVHVLVAAYFLPTKDAAYDPLPQDIVLRDNDYGPGGDDPQGMLQPLAKALCGRLPAVVWDGVDSYGGRRVTPTVNMLEAGHVGFLDLQLGSTPVDLRSARPTDRRPAPSPERPPEPAPIRLAFDPAAPGSPADPSVATEPPSEASGLDALKGNLEELAGQTKPKGGR
ncbi:MAG: parallel beta-helix domain-containing protein [Gammaproteobacteria bacterium]